jgi:hypothetical protein
MFCLSLLTQSLANNKNERLLALLVSQVVKVNRTGRNLPSKGNSEETNNGYQKSGIRFRRAPLFLFPTYVIERNK